MVQVARKAKAREGTVVSDKMDKTVVVTVSSSTRHRLYKKLIRRLRRYMVHDETNDAKLGDRVRIVESRPYSRRKRWQLAEVLVRADRPEVAAEEIDLELLGEVKVEAEKEPETAASAEPEEPAEAVEEPETAASAEPEEPAEAVEEPETAASAEPEESAEAVEEPETASSAEPEEPAEAAEEPEPVASAESEEPAEAAAEPEPVASAESEEPEEAAAEPEPEAKEAPEAEGEEEEEKS
ncbi:MAG: 30S ribosomal protein S17 [Chloroflexi bacterium]|nr:30S ribosomal protein S17 [Chloroflexota bacterium]